MYNYFESLLPSDQEYTIINVCGLNDCYNIEHVKVVEMLSLSRLNLLRL